MSDVINLDEIESRPQPVSFDASVINLDDPLPPEALDSMLTNQGLLRSPEDAASRVGQLASTVGPLALSLAGGGALPVLASRLPAGLRALAPVLGSGANNLSKLQRLANYAKTGLWSATGAEGGEVVSEELGLKEPQSWLGHLGDIAINAPIDMAAGVGIDSVVGAAQKLKHARSPHSTAAKEYAKAQGYSHEPIEEIVEKGIKDSDDIGGSLFRALGGPPTGGAVGRGAAERFANAADDIAELSYLPNARNVSDLIVSPNAATLATKADNQINSARNALAQKLTEQGKTLARGDFDKTFNSLKAVAEEMSSLTPELRPAAASILSTIGDYSRIISSRGSLTPVEAVAMYQGINKARATAQEFNRARVGLESAGDVATSLKLDGSVTALDDIQKALGEKLDQLSEGGNAFSTLNRQQHAIRVLSDQAKDHAFETVKMQKRLTDARYHATPQSAEQVSLPTSLTNAANKTGGAILERLRPLAGVPSSRLAAEKSLGNRGPDAVASLRALLAMRGSTPMTSKAPYDFAAAAPIGAQVAGLGLQAQNAQSMPMSQPIPRTTEAVAQNPQAILQRAAEMSGGNQQLLQDLTTVLKEPNMMRKQTALMEFSKMLPGLFTESPFKSEWDGRIHDPVERDMFGEELKTLQRQGKIDSSFLAKQLSSLNTDGVILPRPQPVQMPPANQGGAGPNRYSY